MNDKPLSFLQLDYLSEGNERQRQAFQILKKINMMERLKKYSPILVGTIPIDVDLPESDHDIICEVHHFDDFIKDVSSNFQSFSHFRYLMKSIHGIDRVVINFTYEGWPIEIFGQPIPTVQQNGYRHMIVEHRILELLGSKANVEIRSLKKQGYKTEPAFAFLLKLEGDPYEKILEIENWDDEKINNYLVEQKLLV